MKNNPLIIAIIFLHDEITGLINAVNDAAY